MSHCRTPTLRALIPLLTLWSVCAPAQVAQNPQGPTEPSSARTVNTTPAPSATTSGASELRLRQARDLFTKGSLAFKAGNHAEAIEAFLLADELVPSAALSFNVARVYEAKGDAGQSIYWYLDYLRRSPDAADAPTVRAKVADLDAALTAEGKQLVVVRCDSPALVFIGPQQVGECPLGVVVEPGTVRLRLVKEGRPDAFRDVDVSQGEVAVLELSWPDPAAARTVENPTTTPKGEDDGVVARRTSGTAREQTAPVSLPAGELAHESWTKSGAWIALGGGALALTLGGVFELVRRSSEADARRTDIQVDRAAELERMSDWKTAARVSAGVGGALLVAGGTLWLVQGAEPSPAATASHGALNVGLTPVLGWNSASLNVSGSY